MPLKYVPDGDKDSNGSFAGQTLLLAAVSNGNVGQLALDCLLYTCAQQVRLARHTQHPALTQR